MYYLSHYKIDFEKVKTLEDCIRILKALDISFEPNHEGLKEIEDLIELKPKNETQNFIG